MQQVDEVTRSLVAEETRARILEAAQVAFSNVGYARAVVRDIAEAADVAPSLIMHYFSSKESLFEEAFANVLDMADILTVPRENFGDNALSLLTATHNDTVRASAMLAQSIADRQTKDIAVRLMKDEVIGPVASWLEGPHGNARAQIIAMLTLGFAAFRILIPLGDPDSGDDHYVNQWTSRALQRLAETPDFL